MTSGGQCVMTAGAALMLLWSADSWDMHTLEVSHCCIIGWEIKSTTYVVDAFAAGVAYSNAHFGAGTGPIFLDDIQCTSSSSQLLECSSRPILTHNCQHSADAGVGCEGKWIGDILNQNYSGRGNASNLYYSINLSVATRGSAGHW